MSTSALVRGTMHQRHSRVPTNDATSSHRLHSIDREIDFRPFIYFSLWISKIYNIYKDKVQKDIPEKT